MKGVPAIITARDIRKRLGDREILNGVSFELEEGQFLSVFGPNGAGKSTLLKIISMLIRPSSGELYLAGKPADEDPGGLRQIIGVLSHHSYLYDSLSARENLRFYGRMYGVKRLAERADELLEQVGLTLFANDPVRTFSRGMIQRLAIARAVVHEPKVLLLDEPYTGLDQKATLILNSVLREAKAAGKTIFMISHNFHEGLSYADLVGILVRGKFALYEPAGSFTPESLRERYNQLT